VSSLDNNPYPSFSFEKEISRPIIVKELDFFSDIKKNIINQFAYIYQENEGWKMRINNKKISILIADDDPDDRLMIKEALENKRLANPLQFVEDGQEVMDYLYNRGKFCSTSGNPLPGLIFLDLNMPKKDGREVLQEIKANPDFCRIPIVVLTTSKAEEDILRSYNLGANSFISKPVTFNGLVEALGVVTKYWIEIVELPVYGV
jgi:CheY-like chemotaxis protein